MSWGIFSTGTKNAVIEKVRNATGYGDTSQLDAAKAFIIAELEQYPDDAAVQVNAGGHHDSTGNRNTNIKIDKVALDL